MDGRIIRNSVFYAAAIVVLAAAVYSNTLNSPFVFDDEVNIVSNPCIKDFGYFAGKPIGPDLEVDDSVRRFFPSRMFGYFTFWLNYRLGGLDVRMWHAVNLAVHMTASLMLYWLMILTFDSPAVRQGMDGKSALMCSFIAAALFAAHPIQTQAVTYIVQRLASMSAMFYIAAIALYSRSRQSASGMGYGWLMLSVAAALLAAKTKETAFTLPIAICLYEAMFFSSHDTSVKPVKRAVYVMPYFAVSALIPISLYAAGGGIGGALSMASLDKIAWRNYFYTEQSVILQYISLLAFPTGQSIDHAHPIYSSVARAEVILPMIIHIALIAVGIFLAFRRGGLKIAGFGILLFYIALSVESGVIPIADVMFEHRVYLPSAGAFVALAGIVFWAMPEAGDRKRNAIILIISCIIAILGGSAYQRNSVWADEFGLWRDAADKYPSSPRILNNAGSALMKQNKLSEAEAWFKKALGADPDYIEAANSLGFVYMQTGRMDEAAGMFLSAIKTDPEFAEAHNNLGAVYFKQNRLGDAAGEFSAAVKLKRNYAQAHVNLGYARMGQGLFKQAEESFGAALFIDPRNKEARDGLDAARDAGAMDEELKRAGF